MRKLLFSKTLLLSTALLLCFSATSYAAKLTTKVTVKVNVSTDKNHNGLPDSWEQEFKLTGTNVANGDADGDGISNMMEFKLKMNPQSADSDHDGIKDGEEDPDGDGLTNLEEIKLHDDPTVSDTDHDGITDGKEDADGDGISNVDDGDMNDDNSDSNNAVDVSVDADI